MSQYQHHLSQLFPFQQCPRPDPHDHYSHHLQPTSQNLQQLHSADSPSRSVSSDNHTELLHHRRSYQHEALPRPLTVSTMLRKGRWSPTEDQRLLASIRVHGPNK